MKKKITNTYHKRLTFPLLDFSIEPGEVKTVSESAFMNLIDNPYLIEVVRETPKKKLEKPKLKKEIKVEKNNLINN